ncbi:type III pantothenate kinase [Alphaproteobacteria bacterium]|nr:type III pantothenate kinase [Alphaproteobacteria bacterium]
MLLAIDIGNTNIVLGIFVKQKLIHKWRLVSDDKKSADDYAVDIIELFLDQKIDCLQINGCIISSVVPVLTNRITMAIKKFTHESIANNLMIIGDEKVKLNIDIKIKNKKEVGHDRLVNAIAGFHQFGNSLIIIDFGTATTFDVVGKNGEYLGGIIAPGINLALKSLHDMTAQLPKISIKPQKNVIGKSTVEAMNSGVYFGYIAMIEGMIKKIEEELGFQTKKIITGGLSDLFKEPLKNIVDFQQSDLTLEGLLLIYNNNNKNNF